MNPIKKISLIFIICAGLFAATSTMNPTLRSISAAVEAVPGAWVSKEIVVTEVNNSEFEPAVAFNWKHNEYLVVWRGYDGIYGQRVSSTGKLVGPKSFAIATGPNTRRSPSVDYDPVHDHYLVVWAYDKGSPEGWNINGCIIPWEAPDTSLPEIEIITLFTDQEQPKVVYGRAQEEFMVVWANKESAQNKSEIYAARLKSSDGAAPAGVNPSRVSKAGEYCEHPDVAYNKKRNEYLVVWDVQKSPLNLDVYGVRLTGNGQVIANEVIGIAGWPNNEGTPAAAACGDEDQYLVAWHSEVSLTNWDIYARVVFGDAVLSKIVHKIEWTPVNELYPDAVCNHNGGQFLVVWQQQYSSTSGPYAISGRFVYPELGGGSILRCTDCLEAPDKPGTMSDIFVIIAPTVGDPSRTKPAAAGGIGDYMVVWEHLRKGSTDQDIHGKMVMPGANFLPLVIRK